MEKKLTAFLHSRGSAALFGAVMVVAVWMAAPSGENPWILGGALAAYLCAALVMVWMNRVYNILRSLTWLVAGMLLVMLAGTPALAGSLYGGTALMGVMLATAALLFSVFDNPTGQRPVFLSFFLVAALALEWRSAALFLPLLLLGSAQMRIFSLRTLLAALMGTVTPVWIVVGFGLIDPQKLLVHNFAFAWQAVFDPSQLPMLACAGFTILLSLTLMVVNLVKILSYNARVRAFNGYFTLCLVYTAALMAVDFGNFSLYVPLLDCMAAYQMAHFFTYRRGRRSYIAVLAIVAVYAAFYCWAVAR